MGKAMQLKWAGMVAAAAAIGLVGSCAQMKGMMGGAGGEQVSLSGANEVPAQSTGASGSGTVTVGSDCSVSAKITVTGMTGTAAHIHEAAAGSNGKVIVPFVKEGDNTFVAPPGAKMTEEQCKAYRSGNTYVNVHSAKAPGGEVRAQLKGS